MKTIFELFFLNKPGRAYNRAIVVFRVIYIIGYVLLCVFPIFFRSSFKLNRSLVLYDFIILIFSIIMFVIVVRLVYIKLNDVKD